MEKIERMRAVLTKYLRTDRRRREYDCLFCSNNKKSGGGYDEGSGRTERVEGTAGKA